MPRIKKEKREALSRTSEKRRAAIMEAAWALFMEKGFDAVSLDEIVERSGGSKSSVYDLFGGKEGLFYAIIEEVTEKILLDLKPSGTGLSTSEELRRIGNAIGVEILSQRAVGLFWLSISVSRKFPDVARLFYESGPRRPIKALAEYLRNETSAGRLKIKDPLRAAEFFFSSVLEFNHMAMALNCKGPPTKAEIRRIVDEAVDIFMKVYG